MEGRRGERVKKREERGRGRADDGKVRTRKDGVGEGWG